MPPNAGAGITILMTWLYILAAGAPPSAIRAGVAATFVLAAKPSGVRSRPLTVRSDNAPKVGFSVTLGEEPEVGVTPA